MFYLFGFCFVFVLVLRNKNGQGMATDIIKDSFFYSLWAFTFKKQLETLHRELTIQDELGVPSGFEGLGFEDFCLLVYQERPDLIDYCQN